VVYEYDIALSFAEEDHNAALALKLALEAKGINKVYYYPDHAQETWGKPLAKQLAIVYAQKARYAVVLLSKAYFTKGYTYIEFEAIQMRCQQDSDNVYMLPILIGDNAELVHPSLEGLTYIRWQYNPKYIADTIALLLGKTAKAILADSQLRSYHPFFKEGNYQKVLQRTYKATVGIRYALIAIGISIFSFIICYGVFYFIESRQIAAKVELPAGSYTMGAHNGRKEDMPAHTVKLNAFTISSREVTIAEYRRFCDSTGKKMPPTPDYPYTEKSPVVNVTWQEAADYCAWVKGRLPTEAEWEYAGVKNSNANDRYSGGNNIQLLGYYEKNSGGKAHTGGQKKGGKLGIYDMSGNVAEWCADWYAPYSSIIQDNPLVSDSSSSRKVLRGGHYNSPVQPDPDSNKLSITYRDSEAPNIRKPYIGFRVVWDQ